ncbi:MAG: hypothetical protein ACFE9M_01180 [Promethearchaeota archaeon]
MPESNHSNKDSHKIIIYHGHIHVLTVDDENEDNNDMSEIQDPDI